MKRIYFLSLLTVLIFVPFFNASPGYSSFKHKFTVTNRGTKFVEVTVPENAKEISAVVSGQTGMLKLAIYAPGKSTPASKNSTWSNLSNWKKPIKCSKNRPIAGTWKIKIEGAVHVGKLDKIKAVSGYLEIFIDGVPVDYLSGPEKNISSSSFPVKKEYQFTIPARGKKYYEIDVPPGAKRIEAVISGQTQMVSLKLFAPGKNVPSCKTTTWSYMSNWKKPLKCWKGKPVIAGKWKIEVEGAVHVGKLGKIKSLSGLLTITVNGEK